MTAYGSGKGPVVVRGEAEIVDDGKKDAKIIITSIPYRVNKSELIARIAELVQEKKIEGIRDIRDESDREGLRVVIELKNDAVPQKIVKPSFMRGLSIQSLLNLTASFLLVKLKKRGTCV